MSLDDEIQDCCAHCGGDLLPPSDSVWHEPCGKLFCGDECTEIHVCSAPIIGTDKCAHEVIRKAIASMEGSDTITISLKTAMKIICEWDER
jgi:hypothetical protein